MSLFAIDLSSPAFQSDLKRAQKKHRTVKSDLGTAFGELENDPCVGDALQRVGEGFFKLRIGVKGLFGKRGGYRLIYHVNFEESIVRPLALYFKPETPALPDEEIVQRFEQMTKLLDDPPI